MNQKLILTGEKLNLKKIIAPDFFLKLERPRNRIHNPFKSREQTFATDHSKFYIDQLANIKN